MIELEFDFNTMDRVDVGRVRLPEAHRDIKVGDTVTLYDGEVRASGVIREINRSSSWVARVKVDTGSYQ